MNLFTLGNRSIVALLVVVFLFVPLLAQAEPVPPAGTPAPDGTSVPPQTFSLKNPLKVDSVGGLVQNFIEIFSYIVILFAVLALVYVGLQFILARGNSTKMTELKGWLFYIVIGVAVVIGARVIIQVVINTLKSTGTVNQQTIQSVQKAVNGR